MGKTAAEIQAQIDKVDGYRRAAAYRGRLAAAVRHANRLVVLRRELRAARAHEANAPADIGAPYDEAESEGW